MQGTDRERGLWFTGRMAGKTGANTRGYDTTRGSFSSRYNSMWRFLMIKIIDNFLDDKHYNDLTSLHIEYSKVHWYGESCSPQNSLQNLISLTQYSDQLSGATAWYNIRPIKPQWHNDIESYCTRNTIQYFPTWKSRICMPRSLRGGSQGGV